LGVVTRGGAQGTLWLGGPAGPSFAASFSHAGVPHPTAVAVTGSEDVLQVYVTEEGQETVFLLTSFGIPIPAPTAAVQPIGLADVVLLNGPGFATDLSLVVLAGVREEPGIELPASEPVRSAADGEPDLARGLPTAPVSGLTPWPASGGGEEGEADTGAEAYTSAEEEAPLLRFLLGVDDALRAASPAPPARVPAGTEASLSKLLDAIAEV